MTAEARDWLHWLRLIRAPGIGPVTAAHILDAFPDPAAAHAARPAQWRAAGLAPTARDALHGVDAAQLDADLAWLAGAGRSLITREDARYPARLREIAQAPVALFCQGDAALLALPQLAVVGARSATAQGLKDARAFAAELARRGLVITSGLALGIDGAAHAGALDVGGSTIAVCATGLDRVYPSRHRELARGIAAQGLLVSEFPPGTPPLAEHFPRRNRLISGLAMGVLVVEAARESGSLITARLAVEQGREVFALPGSIHNPLARGCHQLIRQGAKLVETVDDVLVELAPHIGAVLRDSAPAAASAPPEDAAQARVLAALGEETLAMDELLARARLPAETLHTALLHLELAGRVAPAPGGRYHALR